jgi:penicillin-binding protein 1A
MVVGIVLALGGLGVLAWVISVAATAPPLSSLKMRDLGSNSAVYAADRQPLGFITAVELRRPVEGSRIPEVLKQATVAIEDERFYRHKGVDWEGVVRAGVKNITEQRTVQGGSTITMQLVRNLYISNERTYQRKIREAKLAEELETRHDKNWILVKYLNTAPYGTVNGQSAVGAQAASRLYFGKDVSKLTLAEAALIAGLPQAPSIYSPFRAANAARARRDQVLRKMAQLHLITDAQARAAIKQGLGTKRSTYFTRRREKYFFDYVKDQLIEQYGPARVRQGGLRVYTTIDLKKQQEARKAIADKLAGVGPSSAIVTLDPRNGYIEAMASSSDYGQSVFNLAAQGHRQPGSTFKVMALMTALRKGVNPNSTRYVSRSPTIIPDTPWGDIEIKTYAGKGAGPLSLTQATLKSDNSVYIQLALDLGPEEVKKTARMMGITSKLGAYPAESLGGLTDGVSPLEMARAYATIANGGYRVRPTAITKIVFPDGHSELPKRFKPKRVRAFSDGVTAEATKILERNMTDGTGGQAQIDCPAAGKTGTTDNNTDAWFVGYTPRLATAVWVGYPKRQVFMNSEFFGRPVDGGTFPAQIWGEYMKQAKGGYCGEFKAPKTPIAFKPFEGKYAREGAAAPDPTKAREQAQEEKPEDEEDERRAERRERRRGEDRETPRAQPEQPADPGAGNGTGTGNPNGGAQFDPGGYSSPG